MKFETSKKYCNEDLSLIENYEAAINDNSCQWDVHHRLETHTSDGDRRLVALSADELQALDMYYNRPASELIFMKHSDHVKLHWEIAGVNKGKPHSEETKKRISEAMKGGHHSEEAKKKMSEAAKKRWQKIKTAKDIFENF